MAVEAGLRTRMQLLQCVEYMYMTLSSSVIRASVMGIVGLALHRIECSLLWLYGPTLTGEASLTQVYGGFSLSERRESLRITDKIALPELHCKSHQKSVPSTCSRLQHAARPSVEILGLCIAHTLPCWSCYTDTLLHHQWACSPQIVISLGYVRLS